MHIEDKAVVKENVGKRVSEEGVGKREDEASVDPPKRVVLRETTFPLSDSPHPNHPTKPPTMQPTQEGCNQLNMELHSNPHKKTGATEHGTA